MNQCKKVLIILVMVVIAIILIKLISTNPTKTGITSDIAGKNQADNIGFYYGNLSTEEKSIYDAIKKMYTGGILKTGAEYELIANGGVTQDQVSRYVSGKNTLLSQIEKAKKAFSLDYPEVFYVDFSKLTIRITSNGSNTYNAYLGAGNNENYFIEGITKENIDTKISAYEEKIEKIVSDAQVIGTQTRKEQKQNTNEPVVNTPEPTPDTTTTAPTSNVEQTAQPTSSTKPIETQEPEVSSSAVVPTVAPTSSTNTTSESTTTSKINAEIQKANIDSGEIVDASNITKLRVQYIYDTIIDNASYKFESNCTNGNEAYVRTPYGALVNNEATPSGYARAIKAVLDRLDIPCMVIEDETDTTLEINAYAEIEGKWCKIDDLDTLIIGTPSVKENQNNISYLTRYTNYWKTFDKPSFLENTDIAITDKSSGSKLSANAKDKLMLVSKEINESQTQAMTNKIESTINKRVLKSNTYDIKLMLGQKEIDSTNEKLRISVKFPEGYDANTLGIEYKAYYFTENDAGGIASAVEMPCTVTPYGLIVECDNFSKITIAALAGNISEDNKKVALSSTKGGTVLCDGKNTVQISSGESKNISIVPSAGYTIEKIFILGKETKINENGSTEYTANYNDLQNGNNIVYVSFIPQSVKASRAEETVFQTPTSAKITFAQSTMTRAEGENITINPTVITYGDSYTCKWYKETEELIGQTKEKLELFSITKEDAGRYRLVIITNLGASSITTESTWVTLEVTDKIEPTPTEPIPTEIEPTPTINPTPTTDSTPVQTPYIPTPTTPVKTPVPTPKQTTNQGTTNNTKTPTPKPVLTPIVTDKEFVLPVKTPSPKTPTPTPSPTETNTSDPFKTDVLGSKAENKQANKKSNHVAAFLITVAVIGAGVFVIKKKVIDPKNAQ